MPETDNAALANPKDDRTPADTYTGYGIRDKRRLGDDLDYIGPVIESVPSDPSRCGATRVVPVIVGPETFPLFRRRVLSQRRMRRFIEDASRRVTRNKIHPQYPSNPVCLFAHVARVREVYDVLAPNATARDSVSH